jgi:hypothetical protein
MNTITREMLAAYLDDALGEADTAQVEQALRGSDALRKQLRGLIQEQDRGEHSVGAIWRRQRLSCPSREQLGSWVLGVVEPDLRDYIKFHLRTIGCAYCLANLADLEEQQREVSAQTQQRRRRMFESSAGMIGKKA